VKHLRTLVMWIRWQRYIWLGGRPPVSQKTLKAAEWTLDNVEPWRSRNKEQP
jgi:hypothetical protein